MTEMMIMNVMMIMMMMSCCLMLHHHTNVGIFVEMLIHGFDNIL